MAVIENFNELSEQERLQFAEQLVAKINAENIFLPDNVLKVLEVDADELTGDLTIEVDHEDGLGVERQAGWTVYSEDDTHNPDEDDVEFYNDRLTDVKEAFKTLSAVIDGYKVTVDVYDIMDWDRDDVDVDSVDAQDDGFSYEYWGTSGYEDESSWECEGTIYYTYSVAIALNVEPATETEEN
jgi:hypothetical protein